MEVGTTSSEAAKALQDAPAVAAPDPTILDVMDEDLADILEEEISTTLPSAGGEPSATADRAPHSS